MCMVVCVSVWLWYCVKFLSHLQVRGKRLMVVSNEILGVRKLKLLRVCTCVCVR